MALEAPVADAAPRPVAIPPLTGVRAVAALWVVLHHLRIGALRQLEIPAAIDRVAQLGYLGVDLFGFVSGFVIAHNYADRLGRERRAELAPYVWARLVRIGPLHWAVLALLVATVAFVPGFPARPAEEKLYRAGELPLQILLLHGWSLGNPFAWNLPSWTVSSEWLCYLLFPLAAPSLLRVRDGAQAMILAGLCFVATAFAMRALGHADWNAAIHGGVVRIAGEFAAGCLLQRAWAAGFARGLAWGAASIAAALAVVVGVLFALPTLVVASLGAFVFALVQQRGPLARFFSIRAVRFLGEASYAVYMVHWLVLSLLVLWLPPSLATPRSAADGWLSLAIHVGAVLAASIALHLAFENPARRRLRGLVRRRR